MQAILNVFGGCFFRKKLRKNTFEVFFSSETEGFGDLWGSRSSKKCSLGVFMVFWKRQKTQENRPPEGHSLSFYFSLEGEALSHEVITCVELCSPQSGANGLLAAEEEREGDFS